MANETTTSRPPVYFLSIGGPNFIDNATHPAAAKLAEVGQEITTKIKPKAIVVFSAHWQAGPDTLKVNVAESADIIYDFYNFPSHYYEVKYPNKGSPSVAEHVIEKLESAGIQVDKVERGLDHGVWVGFLAAFDPDKNPLQCPIIQVSLYDNEDSDRHYRIGQALESLRDEGVLIVGAGMAVHSLAGFRETRGTGRNMQYATSFEKALTTVVTSEPNEQEQLSKLLGASDTREAHPTLEHILPISVCAGAAGSDVGEKLWALPEGGMNWAQYRLDLSGGAVHTSALASVVSKHVPQQDLDAIFADLDPIEAVSDIDTVCTDEAIQLLIAWKGSGDS